MPVCLCRRTHGRFKYLSHLLLGTFPNFSTHELGTMTPQMHEAMHREGLRAMSAPMAMEFICSLPKRQSKRASTSAEMETVLESEDEISDIGEEEEEWVKATERKSFRLWMKRSSGHEPTNEELEHLLAKIERPNPIQETPNEETEQSGQTPPLPPRNRDLNPVPLPPKDYAAPNLKRRITAEF